MASLYELGPHLKHDNERHVLVAIPLRMQISVQCNHLIIDHLVLLFKNRLVSNLINIYLGINFPYDYHRVHWPVYRLNEFYWIF